MAMREARRQAGRVTRRASAGAERHLPIMNRNKDATQAIFEIIKNQPGY
jgi:hypothetical protein